MSELHLIITDVDDVSALVEFLNGEDPAISDDAETPSMAIEDILRESGQSVEFSEVEVDGVRNYL